MPDPDVDAACEADLHTSPGFEVDMPPQRCVSTAGELAAAREDAGLTAEELANNLRMSVGQIMALEQGNWEHLPGRAFVRGALRAVARHIDVEVSPLLARVGGYCEPADLVPHLQPMTAVPVVSAGMLSGTKLRGAGPARWRWFAWPAGGIAALAVVGVSLVGATLVAGLSATTDDRSDPTVHTRSAGNSRIVQIPLPGIGSSGFRKIGLNTGADPTSGDASVGNSPTTQAADGLLSQRLAAVRPAIRSLGEVPGQTPAPTKSGITAGRTKIVGKAQWGMQDKATPAKAVPSGIVQDKPEAGQAAMSFPIKMPESESVRLSFSKPTWVDIRHKDGIKLLYGTQKVNNSVVIRGVAPMKVVIGNPDGVKMQFRGKVVDLQARSRKGVSRFVLN